MRFRFYLISLFLLSMVSPVLAQELVVSGKITSAEDKEGIPGVNIVIKGTSSGTVSNSEGKFSVNASPDAILIFSFVGLETIEEKVGNRAVIDIVMKSDEHQLEEIVISGYREESRRQLPGSVAVVKADKIQNVPIASFDQVLQGRVPGLLVSGSSGQPGSSANVLIRGIRSLSGNNDPLYVLDGVRITPGVFNTLNPNDFESISVLKDATAAAIFGSQGANGVILITTKKGKPGQTQVNYNFQYGVSSAPRNRLEVMNSTEKIDFEILTGGSTIASLTSEELTRLKKIETDWQTELFREAFSAQHELNFQGGNDRTTFFISANYLDQEGTVKNTGLKRYTGKINLRHEADQFRIGFNAQLGYSKNQRTYEGNGYIGSPLNAVRWTNPYETPYDTKGDYTVIRTGQPNALQELLENHQRFNDIKAIINVFFEYDIRQVPGLSIRTSWGTDYTNRDGDVYFDKSTYTGSQTPGQSGSQQRSNQYAANFTGTTSVNYKTTIKNDHELFASVYHEIVYQQTTGFNYTGYGLTSNLKNDGGITVSPTFLPQLAGTNTESSLQSYFTEATYTYKKKYSFKGSFRSDNSSRFGANYQNATFYSVGGNWRISEEDFFKDFTSSINALKLYTNIGTSGNQTGIGDFGSLALFRPSGGYDGSAAVLHAQPENPDMTWETVRSFNLGAEFSALKNRLTGTIEYYNSTTIDMLLPSQLSRTSGFEVLDENVGSMRNRGIEIELSGIAYQTPNFTWTVSANFTNNTNEILELVDGDEIVDGLTITKVGYPAATNYLVPYMGVNPANGDPLYRKKNGTLTNEFSTDDLVPAGTRLPPRFGGFSNTFAYKGVELSIFFSWAQGAQVLNLDRVNVENPTYYVDNMSKSILRAWKKPGDITDVPRIQTVSGLTTAPFQAQTTRFVEDGSYLRLRNVLLSYNLPARWVQKAKLRSVKVYAQGQNLWTLFKFQGWDPELGGGVLQGAQYPALRTIAAGINIGL